MTAWNLFIDDERLLSDVKWAAWQIHEKYRDEHWILARSIDEVIELIYVKGMPSFISFDHDLGDKVATGYDIAKKLIEMDMDDYYNFPDNFNFYVHSLNPIGKANIENLLKGYFKAKNRANDTPFDEKRLTEMYNVMVELGDDWIINVGDDAYYDYEQCNEN